MSVSPDADKVCIIGAGPAGLSAARALRRLGLAYDHLERHHDVGGIWDPENPGSPMYDSAHFISSRQTSGFFDFPMPEDYPDYPSNRQILAYTRSFAAHYGLSDQIRFGTEVTEVRREGERWIVRAADGFEGHYRAVICATGVTWFPQMPQHPGTFTGEIRHSSTYRRAAEFAGRKVLIVGLGNSGADIACDAATHADAAYVSIRRGYHMIPKHLFGMPSDEFAERGPSLPITLERPAFKLLLRLLQGDLTKYGMPKPDHKLFESHPLLNDQLLHHLRHGDIEIRKEIERFDGSRVRFTDGTSEEIDLVLYATGYDYEIPFAHDHFTWINGRPQLYLSAFNRHADNLVGLGYLEVNSSAYTLFDQISNIVAQHLADQVRAPEKAARFAHQIATDQPDLSGGLKFLGSARHQGYLDARTFKRYLATVRRRNGWDDLTPGCFDSVAELAGSPIGTTSEAGR